MGRVLIHLGLCFSSPLHTDLAAAKLLQDKINNACELLSEYNERLSAEQVDRELTQRMLVDYVAMQKYQQSKTEQKIEVCFEENSPKHNVLIYIHTKPDFSKTRQ